MGSVPYIDKFCCYRYGQMCPQSFRRVALCLFKGRKNACQVQSSSKVLGEQVLELISSAPLQYRYPFSLVLTTAPSVVIRVGPLTYFFAQQMLAVLLERTRISWSILQAGIFREGPTPCHLQLLKVQLKLGTRQFGQPSEHRPLRVQFSGVMFFSCYRL